MKLSPLNLNEDEDPTCITTPEVLILSPTLDVIRQKIPKTWVM
jgi:hypothetical protein